MSNATLVKEKSAGRAAGRVFKVVFLCTGNSARSIMAEAILGRVGRGRFEASSAGSHPKGEVHPQAIALLKSLGYETVRLRSKSWDEFGGPGAPRFDFIFTVCDQAAGETCPVWPGHPLTAHWGIPDPALATGTDAQIAVTFNEAFRLLTNRINVFAALPIATLDREVLRHELRVIGRMEGATDKAKDGG